MGHGRVLGSAERLCPCVPCEGTSQPLLEDLLETEQDAGDKKLEVITLSRTSC